MSAYIRQALIRSWLYLNMSSKGIGELRSSIMHCPEFFPDSAFAEIFFLIFKAGGEEAKLREEQDMVKYLTIGIICNLIGYKY